MAIQQSSTFTVRKAERRRVKARVAFIGVSGTGKTMSALLMAKGLVGAGKIVLIDTEGGRGELYAGLAGIPEYDVISLTKPFTPDRYIAAIHAAEAAGAECIIVDSTSHAWAGEGGILEFVDDTTATSKSKNAYTEGWRRATPKHNALVETLTQSTAHMIVTMRAKAKYVEDDRRGYKKVGLEPVQRDGLEYEFMLVLDIDLEHRCTPSKDNTNLFDGTTFRVTEQTGLAIKEWIASGKEGVAPPSEIKTAPVVTTVADGMDYDLLVGALLGQIDQARSIAELSLAYSSALDQLKKLTAQRGESTGDEARDWHRAQMKAIATQKDARKAQLSAPPAAAPAQAQPATAAPAKKYRVINADGMEVMLTDEPLEVGQIVRAPEGNYTVASISLLGDSGRAEVHVVSAPDEQSHLPADKQDEGLRQLELSGAA